MQIAAYEGYFENGRFFPLSQPVLETGKVRAILTVLDEPVKNELIQLDDSFVNWHNRLKRAITASMDEDLPDIIRSKELRPPVKFNK